MIFFVFVFVFVFVFSFCFLFSFSAVIDFIENTLPCDFVQSYVKQGLGGGGRTNKGYR